MICVLEFIEIKKKNTNIFHIIEIYNKNIKKKQLKNLMYFLNWIVMQLAVDY